MTIVVLLSVLLFSACESSKSVDLLSPNGEIAFDLEVNENGQAFYKLQTNKNQIFSDSRLGMEFREDSLFTDGLRIINVVRNEKNENWKPVWGTK